MSQYKKEYSGPAVSSSACSYNTLGSYYGCNASMAPLRQGTAKNVFVVPQYGAIGYDALTHGVQGGCANYFNIQQAYGKNAGNCKTKYSTRLCNSGGCQ